MTKRYLVVDGEVLGETANGQRTTYIPDPSGNVIALQNDAGEITETFDYWPYGELSQGDSSPTVHLRFAGTYGYYDDLNGRAYVRARHYLPSMGRWMGVDARWLEESAYGYCINNPITFVDPSGSQGMLSCPTCPTCAAETARRIRESVSAFQRWLRRKIGKCRDLTPAEKAVVDECRQHFAKCGWNIPAYTYEMCSSPDDYGWAIWENGKCIVQFNSTNFPSRGHSRCETLLHESLHCMCNVEDKDPGHENLGEWSWHLWTKCAASLGIIGIGRTPLPPPSQVPSDICDKIRRLHPPPR